MTGPPVIEGMGGDGGKKLAESIQFINEGKELRRTYLYLLGQFNAIVDAPLSEVPTWPHPKWVEAKKLLVQLVEGFTPAADQMERQHILDLIDAYGPVVKAGRVFMFAYTDSSGMTPRTYVMSYRDRRFRQELRTMLIHNWVAMRGTFINDFIKTGMSTADLVHEKEQVVTVHWTSFVDPTEVVGPEKERKIAEALRFLSESIEG